MTQITFAASEKPTPLPVLKDNIPLVLREKPQWVVWRYTWKPDKKRKDGSGKKGDWDKPPFSAHTGRRASSTNPETWATFEVAWKAYKSGDWSGIGFVAMPEDKLVGIDLDHCYNRKTRKAKKWASRIVKEVNSYTEITPSGTGFRIIAIGHKPDRERAKKGPIEIYDGLTKEGKAGGRYLTITGRRVKGRPAELCERQSEAEVVYNRELKPPKQEPKPKQEPGANGKPNGLTDEEIINKASGGKNGDRFKSLWSGSTNEYPSQSEADLALCGTLAFYCGPDPARIDRLFRQSGLMREKWERDDYRNGTIAKALEGRTESYHGGNDANDDSDDENPNLGAAHGGGKKKSRATEIVDAARKHLHLWHTPEGIAYATVREKPHATWALRRKSARQFLDRLYYQLTAAAAGDDAIRTAICTLEGLAVHDGDEQQVHTRLAEHEGRIYLDLGDDQWRAVAVSPDGWEVVEECPVHFQRSRGMLALPEPVRGGSVEALRDFINLPSDSDFKLAIAWLRAALRPVGPFPVLCLHGEQGAAKSTGERLLRSLIDPNKAPLRAEPKEPRDLIIAAENAAVIALDNLSKLPP
jgi:hypothetical protein